MRLGSILVALLLIGGLGMSEAQELGVIGEVQEDGFPVVYKFLDEVPSEGIRSSCSWLTVVSWTYDGRDRNGMPPDDTNQRMIALEEAIETALAEHAPCRHAYSRTGNHLKELVFYVADREGFMAMLNEALQGHPTYPIEIVFYEDPEWQDLRKVLDLFGR